MKKLTSIPLMLACGASVFSANDKPNVILIYIDDMGYSDLSCYGGNYAPTPNIDKLAEEGIRFTQYYSASPISSPSRVGLTTGMFPTRWGINTFLQTRDGNAENEQNDFLNDKAPSMARMFKANGYATGHFGKWHMGGGRDVYNAPSINTYGFDAYNSTWESPNPDPKLTATDWIWAPSDEVKRWNRTAYFVDKTLDFLAANQDSPCFINLWPDDVHTPWVYENDETSQRESAASFTKVLKELDVQIGRLMQGIKDLGIDENTIVIFTSDNGPAPAFEGNRTQSLRGQKATLYEGGIRMPFIIRWSGHINPGIVNNNSIVCSVDLLPSLCAITNTTVSTEFNIDGEDMSTALLGNVTYNRSNPVYWEFGKRRPNRVSPHIAIREGEWKLLVNGDGSNVELYNMDTDMYEQHNVASSQLTIANRLKTMAINWYKTSYRQYADKVLHVSSTGSTTNDGSSWDKAITLNRAVTLSGNAVGSQLWLKEGIYEIGSSVNFDNLQIYGGFAGDETELSERDWNKNQTILDGKNQVSPLRNDKLTTTVTSLLDGVIVQNGLNHSSANGNGNGGGMILASGATVRNCIFRNNRTQNAKNGAAIHCHLGSITIENSLFINNSSSGNGGGVQVGGSTNATIINCTFANNTAIRPGGAIGLGNNTSNLTITNSLAHNNLYGSAYNSFGQNDNMNSGGTVISRNSAIESASTKFTDGDDVEHKVLSRSITPGFVSPSTVLGYSAVLSEVEQINSASYQLSYGSICIDAGNTNYISYIDLDLAGNNRISGTSVDIGAYEYKITSSLYPKNQFNVRDVRFKDGWIFISNAKKNDKLSLYSINGTLVHSKTLASDNEAFEWNKNGFYLMRIENEAFKVLVQ
jgi:arylsulfatase A-like enzyme